MASLFRSLGIVVQRLYNSCTTNATEGHYTTQPTQRTSLLRWLCCLRTLHLGFIPSWQAKRQVWYRWFGWLVGTVVQTAKAGWEEEPHFIFSRDTPYMLLISNPSSPLTILGNARVLGNTREHGANHGHSASVGAFAQASSIGGSEQKSPIYPIKKLIRWPIMISKALKDGFTTTIRKCPTSV